MHRTLPGWLILLAAGCRASGPAAGAAAGPTTIPATRPATAPVAGQRRIELVFVPEMESLGELENWPRCRPGAYARQARQAAADWKRKAGLLQRKVTAERVRGLSRWAKKQMESYASVPPLADVSLQPVRAEAQHGKLLLEGTAETLPSHHRLVTRWLKVYVVYDPTAGAIEKAIITIRGQVLE